MLKALRITNLAIIDDVSLEFPEHFTVMTGETGAGKSILVDGLGLALGERADKEMIRTGCEEARVESLFDLSGLPEVSSLLADLGIPLEGGELSLRRIITASGKSRSQANGSPVPLAQMKRIGDLLADLHGQHDHQLLLNEANHVKFLDAFGGLHGLCGQVRQAVGDWRALGAELSEVRERERQKTQRLDLLSFQAEEISAARISAGEDVTLAEERSRLANARRIVEGLSQAVDALTGEGGAGEALGSAFAAVKPIAEFDRASLGSRMESLKQMMESAQEEAIALREVADKLEADPKRLEELEERLDLLSRIKQKYGGSLEKALEYLEQARAEIQELGQMQERAAELAKRFAEAAKTMTDLALTLSENRAKSAKRFSSEVAAELRLLAMAGAGFGVSQHRREVPDGPAEAAGKRYFIDESGIDSIEFIFAPNPGEDSRALKNIASGGELSRIMLALKSVLAGVDRVGTLIFDEIDAGIGGRVAEVVGRKLKLIGRERQVICITHLPQIAARAQHHIVVRKIVKKGHAAVTVSAVENQERIEELARMLAGSQVTQSALKHAATLLKGD